MPAVWVNDAGEPRRVGFELEFSGVPLDTASSALADALGVRRRVVSEAEHRVVSPALGDFRVEVDWRFLKKKAAENAADDSDGEWIAALSQLASLVVPLEVVCPPIAVDELSALDDLVLSLRNAGATGTSDSPLAAYGVHINAEAPSLDATTLRGYLRAYCLLQWWLLSEHDIDTTRRLSPYVDLYPEAYLHAVHDPAISSLEGLIDLYLEHNPTRNRALDMLPLFSSVDEARVQRVVADPLINARPAFHYRLPDCHIEKVDWSLARPWKRWCVVEALAADESALDELALRFSAAKRPIIGVDRGAWVREIGQWLADHGLV
jgi:hypothetical protein